MEFENPQFHDSLDEIAPSCVTPILVGHERSMRFALDTARGGHHALIFDGEQGIGKATAAFHLANAVIDNNLDREGLGRLDTQTSTYRQVGQNAHPNLLYLTRPLKDDGKGFKTVITVDEVRRLQRFLGMTASGGERRVVIIDCLNDMNRNAANAALKLLEEPPANTLFLLIAHGMGGLLPTIRSRCQVIRFAPLEPIEVELALKTVAGDLLTEAELSDLAALSGGSVRYALLMARNGGIELRDSLMTLLNDRQYQTGDAHKLADVAATRGSDIHNTLLRQMMLDDIRRRAVRAAAEGNIRRANLLAKMDIELSERARIAEAFNLDRRQEFLVVASKVHTLLHSA